MADAPLIQREISAYKDLEALIAERAKREFEIELQFEKRVEKEENEYQAESASLHSRFRSEIERLKGEYQQAKAKINAIVDDLIARHGPDAEDWARGYEEEQWCRSNTYEQGKWRRVRRELWRRYHAGEWE